MAEIKQLFQLASNPGIKRDGTLLDGNNYSDGQWVRFQRGRPKKIGGYQLITDQLRGPIYNTLVWSKSMINNIFSFHSHGIEMVQVDNTGGGSSVIDRTPTGFVGDSKIQWSADTMFDAAAGSPATVVLALPASLIGDIDDQTERSLYVGDVTGVAAFTDVTDANAVAAGGVFVTGPYAVLYGKDGKVTWSNANEPQNYTTGDAGTARVTGSKIIKGMSLRSGNGSGGLLWTLDSVVRQDWIGGDAIFKFSTLSRQSSIISANSVVEYDGSYYWVGSDRFMMTNGSQVNEIPNDMNLNWFFDNLNIDHRTKVHGVKVPRFGEIWWFYPRGENTECSHAVILNVRENSWYDLELPRTSGYHQQVFRYPVMAGQDTNTDERVAVLGSIVGTFSVGDTITGTSGASAEIYGEAVDNITMYVRLNSTVEFVEGENITNSTSGGTAVLSSYEELYAIYTHEHGHNVTAGDFSTAINSWITSADIGLPTGGTSQSPEQGLNRWTRLVRVEPDFLVVGEMTLEVLGKEFANSEEIVSGPYVFDSTTNKIDIRVQHRHLRLKFTSNTSDGSFEMGKNILHTEPGDIRS